MNTENMEVFCAIYGLVIIAKSLGNLNKYGLINGQVLLVVVFLSYAGRSIRGVGVIRMNCFDK